MSENIFLEEFGIKADAIAATNAGVDILRSRIHPENTRKDQILGLIRRFADQPEDIDTIFRPYPGNEGSQSRVHKVGRRANPLVVKVSTPDTVTQEPTAQRPLGPEDLITQLMVLNTMKTVLEDTTNGVITSPQHHYAMRVRDGYSLSVMDFMDGWVAMDFWLNTLQKRGFIIERQREQALWTVNDRIQDAVDNTPFDEVIDDLYEDGNISDKGKVSGILRADNVLIPQSVDIGNINTMPLCLIDQPPPFPRQLAAARLAIAHFAYRPDYLIGEAVAA